MTTFTSITWIFRQAFAAAPVALSVTTAAAVVLAAAPAVQVLLIGAVIEALSGDAHQEAILPLLLALGLVAGLAPALGAIVGSYQARASQKLQARLNVLVAREAARVPPSLLVSTSISAEIERHSRAIGEGIAWSVRNILGAAASVLAAIGVVAAVFSYSTVAGLLTIAALIPPILHSRHLAGVWEREWGAVAAHYDRERYLRDLVVRQRSAAELSGLGTSERVAGMVAQEWTTIQRILGRALVPQAVGSAIGGVVTSALLVGAIVSVVIGSRFDSAAAAGIYGVLAAVSAASGAGLSAGMVLEQVPLIARLQEFLASSRPSRAIAVHEDAAVLEVDSVSHRYHDDAPFALRDASFSVRKGEIVAIVGPNGAGKTTLVHAITGLLTASSGAVSVDGIQRQDVSEAQWLARFALMTQEFGRFELTVREAVLLGTPRADVTDAEVWEALRRARADTFVRSMPRGLDQQLGEQFGGVGVSGGQWQRLALARISLRDAPIWILDEPTSAIDAESENEIFAELAAGRSERITLVVSHRAWTLKAMDRILVVDDGAIVESGTYGELVAAGGRFAELFASQR